MPIPSLDTERLLLRGHVAEDFDDVATLWSDPVVTRYIGGRPFSVEESWTKLLRYVGHWSVVGYGYWVVRERATGRFVGEVGFADFHRDITPGFDGAPESGWVILPWAHGRGYATEAVSSALAWMDARRPAPARTVCIIDLGNEASVRVARKVGYREWTRTDYKGAQAVLFERETPRAPGPNQWIRGLLVPVPGDVRPQGLPARLREGQGGSR